jgi:hypothetical protein
LALIERQNAPHHEPVRQHNDRQIGQTDVEISVLLVVPADQSIF